VGVVKDFHFSSLRQPISSLILFPIGEPPPGARFRYAVSIKTSPGQTEETLEHIKNIFLSIFPNDVFEYQFFTEALHILYRADERSHKAARYFCLLAIFIACMGLAGLASFTTGQRTKEIGVRRVLGASSIQIVYLIIKPFNKWILVANIVSWPIAYFAMDKWLQAFAYRAQITIWPFLYAALITHIIALLTISYQAICTAGNNPINSLKYE
jgi:putative ABC transport system permease protein